MVDYTEPPKETGPETFVNTGQLFESYKNEIARLKGQLAEVTEQRDEAWKTVHEYSLHAFANMSKQQQADIMKIFKELAGE